LTTLNPAQTATDDWLDATAMAFTEAPPRRRMVRPLRQHVDLKLVPIAAGGAPDVDPSRQDYDREGNQGQAAPRPGRLLNVRV
jgi:hypothetical protein